MTLTAAATALLAIAKRAGATDYDTLRGNSATSKLARLRLPNGRPIVIQTNNKQPRIWLRSEHDCGALAKLGRCEHYEASRTRHHHLRQVREFDGRPLVKVSLETTSWPAIEAALAAVGAISPSRT